MSSPKPSQMDEVVNALLKAGYIENEIEAFIRGYTKARGGHPQKYHSGWRALDFQRIKNNWADDKELQVFLEAHDDPGIDDMSFTTREGRAEFRISQGRAAVDAFRAGAGAGKSGTSPTPPDPVYPAD